MKGIRVNFEHFYPSITEYADNFCNARKARYLGVLSWVIVGRRLGLPNEIIEMIKCKLYKYDIERWFGTYDRILKYERKRVIEAKRVLKSFQKKKNFIIK